MGLSFLIVTAIIISTRNRVKFRATANALHSAEQVAFAFQKIAHQTDLLALNAATHDTRGGHGLPPQRMDRRLVKTFTMALVQQTKQNRRAHRRREASPRMRRGHPILRMKECP
jgi:hypothetical protein